MRLPSRHLVAALLLAGSLPGCGDSTTTAPPVVSLPLIPGTWYLHEADGEALPAMISDRFLGISQEQTFLDSAQLVVRSNATFEQRYWMRVLVTGSLDREETVIDYGNWVTSAGQHDFTSTVRDRSFSIVSPSLGVALSLERFVTFLSGPETDGVYRLSRP